MSSPQRKGGELTLYVVLAVTAVAIIGAMLFILRSGNQMIAKIAPLADATMEIGVDATHGHLWLMEAAVENNPQHFDTAMYYLRRADRYAQVMLEGGTIGDVTLSSLDDEDMRAGVIGIRRSLAHLLGIEAHQLPELLDEHIHGSRESHSHDDIFSGLLDQTAFVESYLRDVINREHTNFKRVQLTLISLCIGFFFLVASVLYRYIAAQKRYEARIQRLNLILRAIRNVNHLITREKDRRQLITSTCELLVDTRGLHNAWITLVDETGKPTIHAEAGLGEAFEPAETLLADGQLLPCCLRSLKHEGVLVVEDPHAECPECPLSEKYTGRSGLATKLEHSGKVYGFMVVSSPREYAFDGEEHVLFAELAQDIGLSLHLISVEEDRIRAEQALRESEGRYRTLAANIPGSDIYLFDGDMRYLVAEGSELRKNGLTSEFYEGKTLHEAWDESLVKIMEPLYFKALQGKTASAEFQCCKQHYSLSTVPVRNGHKEIVGGIALSQNISERKRAEKALRLTRFSIDKTADIVFWCSSKGRLLDVNPAGTQMLGYERDEFLAMNIWDVDPGMAGANFEKQWAITRKCKTVTLESNLQAKDGRTIPVEIQINHIEFEGNEYNCGFVRDITDRKRSEEALKRSEGLLRHTFEAIPDLISVHDRQYNVVLSNWHGHTRAFNRFTRGAKKCYAAYMNATSPCEPCYAREVFESKKPIRIESTGTADGRTRETNIYPVLDELGEVTLVTETVRDITESKKAEKLQSTLLKISVATNLTTNLDDLLKIIHSALTELIDTTNFYVALYDEVNDRYTFPYSIDSCDDSDFPHEMRRKTLTDYVRRTGKPLLIDEAGHEKLRDMGEVMIVGEPSKVWLGIPLTTARGVIGVVALQSYVNAHLYSESDKELMTVVSGHITMAVERKLAEEALRKSEERLRAMYEQASVGVALLAANGHWLTVNERLCEIVGYTRDELLGMTCRELTHPDDVFASDCIVDNIDALDRRSCTCEKRYKHKNGRDVWVNVSAAFVSEPDEEEQYMVAIIQDVTERKSAERMISNYTNQLVRANRALEDKQSELEEFIYTISHDLKAPIVSISGFAGLIKEKLSGEVDEVSARQLDRILINSAVMETLINDLLELSRIGCTEEPAVTFSFEELADEVIDSFSVAASKRSIKLYRTSEMPPVTGHFQRVRQLLTNLVDNAIKYMPASSEGRIEIGYDHTVSGPDGETAAYFVRDNGDGIPEEYHDRIFNMFQRAGNGNSEPAGSGVGLAIVKRIVQTHGGKIWLKSGEGRGATFFFTLPGEFATQDNTFDRALSASDIESSDNKPSDKSSHKEVES